MLLCGELNHRFLRFILVQERKKNQSFMKSGRPKMVLIKRTVALAEPAACRM